MHTGKLLFAQLMGHLPPMVFERCVARYGGHHKVKSFSCMDQFLCMAFAQLTFRESLRDIEACLRSQAEKLYHMGIRAQQIAQHRRERQRDLRLAYLRILRAALDRHRPRSRSLPTRPSGSICLGNSAYALDSTTIDLSLSLFPWAPFRTTKAAVKLHTLLDLRGNIPSFIHISDGKLHDVNILDQLIPEAGAFYVMDRGYIDFARLYRLHQAGSFFVTRAKKKNMDAAAPFASHGLLHFGVIFDQNLTLVQGYRVRRLLLSGRVSRDLATGIPRPASACCSSPTTPRSQPCRSAPSTLLLAGGTFLRRWIKKHSRIKVYIGTLPRTP